MHYIKLLNYNTKVLFISMSVTHRVVLGSCQDVLSSALLFWVDVILMVSPRWKGLILSSAIDTVY